MLVKDGRPVVDLEDWRVRAGPKSEAQWKAGRSAMESARAWLDAKPAIPTEIAELLVSHDDLGALDEWTAVPEAPVRFDGFRGEPANLDVLVTGASQGRPFVVAVEAKADEPFGATVGQTAADAASRLTENPRSKGRKRIEQLLQAILGVPAAEVSTVAGLRYQLLTASAAAICEAERNGSSQGIVVVHEFVTTETDDTRHDANASDLNAFVTVLSGDRINSVDPGVMLGPFMVPGTPLTKGTATLYLGKAVRRIRDVGV